MTRRWAIACASAALVLAGCGPSETAPANEMSPGVRVAADCCVQTAALAPDGSKTLLFTPDEAGAKINIRVSSGWLRQYGLGQTETPVAASWSPDSRAVYLNDGEGSGQTSAFRLILTPANEEPREIGRARQDALAAYRSRRGCPASARRDAEVWGLGWSADGQYVHILVQSSVHEPCGSADQFMVMTARVLNGEIVARYDTEQARSRFGALLPSALLAVTAP